MFAQVHDVLMKMILTGMLIYVPSTSRAGIATLVCVVACCNLNFFEPHKNNLLFWLTQMSFITTTAKYIVALLLSVDTASQGGEEQTAISILLITLDILFMSSSVLAMLAAVWLLRTGIKKIQTVNINDNTESAQNNNNNNNNATHIVPVNNEQPINAPDNSNNFITSYTDGETANALGSGPGHALRQSLGQHHQHHEHQHHETHAKTIHQNFQKHEDKLMQKQAIRAKKVKRHTLNRVAARLKIRQTKTLTNVAMFSQLTPEQIEQVVLKMSYENRNQGDIICDQGEDAHRFYIIVKGSCAITTKADDGSERRVTTLSSLEYFGESSLIGKNSKRNATVTVISESMQLLHLERSVFEELVRANVIDNAAIDHAKELADARANVRHSHALQSVSLFANLSDDAIANVIQAMEIRTYEKDETLTTQGDEDANEFMVILQGTASVAVDGEEVRTFRRLDVLGEAALVEEHSTRGATVTATKEVQVLVLCRDQYQELFATGSISEETNAKARRQSEAYAMEDAARLK
jgi:CRP-like cAMP-binding protein